MFKQLTADNPVLKKLAEQFIQNTLRHDVAKTRKSGLTEKIREVESRAYKHIVERLNIVLTMPEEVLIQQEDAPDEIPARGNQGGDGDDKEEQVKEPRMYFIAKGKYFVKV